MVLLRISLITNVLSNFSCDYWPFVYLLLRSVCSNLLSIFILGYKMYLDILDISSLSEILSPSLWLTFCFLTGLFKRVKVLPFGKVQFFKCVYDLSFRILNNKSMMTID